LVTGAKTDEWADYARRLGIALSRRRHAVGLSQERLANAAGLTRGYYQQLEQGASRTGRVANPTLQNLIALAQVLDTTIEELLPPEPPDMRTGR
jgi:transcriptional regulator with XRE-family HTH domain